MKSDFPAVFECSKMLPNVSSLFWGFIKPVFVLNIFLMQTYKNDKCEVGHWGVSVCQILRLFLKWYIFSLVMLF